jgi:hypothetical protein
MLFSMLSQLRLRPCAAVFALLALLSTARGDELDPSIDIAPEGFAAPVTGATVLRPIERVLSATHPLLRYSYTHAESVLSGPARPQSTSIQDLSVTLHWNLGRDLLFRYTPTWTFYSNSVFEDNVSHQGLVYLRHGFVDWNLLVSDRYLRTSRPLIETARQTTEERNTAEIQAQRSLGSRATLELGVGETTRTTQNFTGFMDWFSDDWVHYELSSHILVSGGFGFGYVDMDDGPDMNYRRVNGRIRWRVTEKIKIDARAGYEARRFEGPAASASRAPIYGFKLSYQPLELTALSVQSDRRLTPSYFSGQIDRIANWQIDVRQRFFGRFYADVAFVRRTATHHFGLASGLDTREDSGRSWHVRVTANPRPNCSLSVFYQTKRNRSSDAAFGFDGDVFGAEFDFRF